MLVVLIAYQVVLEMIVEFVILDIILIQLDQILAIADYVITLA